MSVRIQRVLLVLAMLVMPASAAFIPTGTAVVAQTTTTATTTDQLNMRTGPSTGNPVILVIPYGATVTVRGDAQGGFFPISYNGRDGWSSSDYLALAKPSTSEPRAGVTTDFLNLRSGPSGSNPVIAVIPSGASVVVNGESSNGYLSVTWSGFNGFAHRDWIRIGGAPAPVPPPTTTPPASGTAVTTDALNLRAGAGTTFTVLTVIPSGASVTLTGQTANGFYGVTWGGHTGWASAEYLRVTSGQAPAPAPPPPTPAPTPPPTPVPTAPPVTSTTGTGIVTDSLNMRTGPATTYPVVLVIPVSATVELTGNSSGNFLEVRYSGRTGWAHKDWIRPQQTETRPTSSARVTETLNLRSGPATTYAVLSVMPAGATVVLTGQESNGFHSVTFNGVAGWAFTTYLDITPAGQPQPTIPPTPVPTQPPQPTQPTPPPSNAGFATTNAIVGPIRGTPEQAIAYAQRAGANRMDQVELYIREIYRFAPQVGFDPALLIAQSALETGYWKSHWWTTRLNPAGLGITDDPNVHEDSQGFANGTISARAQMAHMHAEVYGSRQALPPELQGVDETYEAVFRAGWAGTIVTLEDLSGTWATDPDYAQKIVVRAIAIFG